MSVVTWTVSVDAKLHSSAVIPKPHGRIVLSLDPMRGEVKRKTIPYSPVRGGCLTCIQPDLICIGAVSLPFSWA